MNNQPSHLQTDHLGTTALVASGRRPRLSWWLPDGSARQLAYRITCDAGWDSGRVEEDGNLLVPYRGPEPDPGRPVAWRVKVWTDVGESDWSERGYIETLPDVWAASWIEPDEAQPADPGHRPAHLLRHDFTLAEVPEWTRLYATAHGIYELYVNGTRIGDQELAPGFTAYRVRLHVQAYDVTNLLRPGSNTIGAVVSDGWFRGRTGFHRVADGYGTRTAFFAQLTADGSTAAATGRGWLSRPSEIIQADLMDGQTTDQRRVTAGWSEPGADLTGWSAASVADGGLYADLTRLTASPAPPVRRIEERPAISITNPRPGVQVVDFGQNVNGWVRLTDLGPAGTALTLTHGEALGPDGDVTLDHLAAHDGAVGAVYEVGQRDRVISSGRAGEVFEPRHTTHGFQYVRVEGHPDTLAPAAVSAVVVHSDLRRTGWFTCDGDRINRLHEAAVWSFRGNACDIPTDCPTRERAGFTGDWQIFAPTAMFLYDCAGFSIKWLRDLASDQWPDGRVPNWAPEPGLERRADPLYDHTNGSAGWGDAAVIVPWHTYLASGDGRILAEQYDSMVRWIAFAAGKARSGRFPERAAAMPAPAPHEEYLWDSGFHWGEWTEPGSQETTPFWAQDQSIVATAYLYRSTALLARIATLLGRGHDAAKYSDYADNVLNAWRTEFLRPDGTLTLDTQATHVRALAFGLVPDELRPTIAQRLVDLIRKAGNHLSTGFLATPYLLPVLADTGHLDVAYELLLQDTSPSWLAMVYRGATTIWEEWDGIDENGEPHASLNHYSKGAVISFLHTHVAGIRLREDAPAYKRFEVRPRPGGGLSRAEARLDSPYGRITSRWQIAASRFTLEVNIPPGTTATITLPDGSFNDATPGNHRYTCPAS